MQSEAGRAEFNAELVSDAGCSRAMATLFTVEARTLPLLLHSLLHLLGYDHETDADWARMTQREEEVLARYYASTGAAGAAGAPAVVVARIEQDRAGTGVNS